MSVRRCRWCGVAFKNAGGPGRPREFCKRSHRQRLYEAERAATKLGLGGDDVLVSKRELDALRDRIYVLEAAVEDVRADLTESHDLQDYADAYVHLLEGALNVVGARIEPRAIGS